MRFMAKRMIAEATSESRLPNEFISTVIQLVHLGMKRRTKEMAKLAVCRWC
jgi:hypothetical protein